MTGPIDAITAIHNAFRKDMEGIDAAALAAARGTAGHEAALERFRFFNEVLVWHAHGEELAIFPAVDGVAPLVAEAYEKDHRGLDAIFEPWTKRSRRATHWRRRGPRPPSSSILDFHLFKEDTHLYRIVRERVPVPDQGKAVGIMAAEVPQDRQPELIAWMYPLIGDDDRENMTAHLADGDAGGSVRGSHAACPAGGRRRLGGADAAHARPGSLDTTMPGGDEGGTGRPLLRAPVASHAR